MKIILRLVIFLATAVFVLLLPIYFLLWQQSIIVKTVITTQNNEYLNVTQLTELTKQTLNFLLNKDQLPNIFANAETDHMADVALLVKQGFYTLVIVFFILILLFIFFKFLGSPEVFYKLFRNGAIFSMVLLFVLALLVLIDFTVNFIYFHNIFFPQGNFIFPENSLLIQIFPERFFKEIMIYVFMGAVILSSSIITLATYKLREK